MITYLDLLDYLIVTHLYGVVVEAGPHHLEPPLLIVTAVEEMIAPVSTSEHAQEMVAPVSTSEISGIGVCCIKDEGAT